MIAGDWIKIEHAMPDKPEIVRMAQLLNVDHDSVSGKCLRLWIWADQQTREGYDLSVTDAFIDRLTYCPGFADALRKVGWLEGREGRLSIPNFSRHNGQTAKKRALSKDRMQRKRCADNVTDAQPEKRREEKSKKKKTTSSKKFTPPSVEEVAAYCRERGNSVDAQKFVDHYTANDWIRGKTKIKDWKACVRTWEGNQQTQPAGATRSPASGDAAANAAWNNVCAAVRQFDPKYQTDQVKAMCTEQEALAARAVGGFVKIAGRDQFTATKLKREFMDAFGGLQ
ncbi:MAG: hypothetical protein Fues2KO_47500 [Fuerstiella sp.]